ncbi:uncharacterized protein [Epargyreus clarus]|uniref:uncharacterized protein n=1 Tax=Epargyreus clarus TaxID=520877 RepID=UPI003C30A1C7
MPRPRECHLKYLNIRLQPINYCNMASTCIHDSIAVCASTQDGCSRRGFLDTCDMYEYNCDYGTQYVSKATTSCTNGEPNSTC